ncbi:site-2 protease family protein [Bengtsoniella intestinalis]|uniref:site-2 protease family protein n=1 Tax=Bengtsoniella intestinalis TaxID=3073143 RepID=UPI00391FBC11
MHYFENLVQSLDFSSVEATVLRVVAVLLCLTIHETAHGFAAFFLGDNTAYSQNRLSLNPIHHIDWFGLLMMFTVGFGWAKPVPVNMRHFKNPKRDMAITALAGPISNFLLAILIIGCAKLIFLFAPYSDGWNTAFEWCLYTAAPLSVGLGLFNLLPVPPLDGSRVMTALLPNHLYYQIMRYERIGMLVMFALVFLGFGSSFISQGIYWVYGGMLSLFF